MTAGAVDGTIWRMENPITSPVTSPANSADLRVTKFVQSRLWGNKLEFTFEDDKLIYHLEMSGVNTTKEVAYSSIQIHAQDHRISSSQYFRNIGVFFLAYGIFLGLYNPSNYLFAPFGAAFLIYFAVTRFGYSVYPAEGGNILIIDGDDKDKILAEITTRRIASLRKLLSAVNYKNTKERELAKYEFLKKEKAISDVEYDLYVSQVSSEALKFPG